jgi:hypothetical protein
MTDDDIRIRETTVPRLSGYAVAVSNIWTREPPDVTGPDPCMSAQLTIFKDAAPETRRLFVCAGDAVELGEDRYRVVDVISDEKAPGWIILRKDP